MFDKWRSKLSGNIEPEEEEITFRSVEKETAPAVQPEPEEAKGTSIDGANIELKVVRPESIEEVFTIADYLLKGCTVVLNMELLDGEQIKRMLDFLNGVTYTTNGEVKNVSQGTYIITPSGINVDR